MALAKGNPNLIKTLAGVIQNMINHATQDFQKAVAHWQQGEAQQAASTLHTLRGSIGTLGAKDFAQAALTLENAISHQDQVRMPALLANAEQQLQLTITSVQAWLHAHDAGIATPASPISQLQPEQLQEFKTLLQTQNMKASALYQELQAGLQHTGHHSASKPCSRPC